MCGDFNTGLRGSLNSGERMITVTHHIQFSQLHT